MLPFMELAEWSGVPYLLAETSVGIVLTVHDRNQAWLRAPALPGASQCLCTLPATLPAATGSAILTVWQ
jgi:hypothetical protein